MSDCKQQRMFHGVDCRDKEIFEITPVILGGSPTDLANKTVLERADHIKAVGYWNKVVRELRANTKR
jgi:hypothetical protein